MSLGIEAVRLPGYLQEYAPTSGEVFKAAVESTLVDGVTGRALDKINIAVGGGPHVPKSEILERAKEAGVVLTVPDDGMDENVVEALIERKYNQRQRQEILSENETGYLNQLSGEIVGSLLDPVNLASMLIPFAGAGKYAAWMAATQNPFAKAGIRFGYGAANAAIGITAVEPINYALAQSVDDDYTLTNSIMNIAFGSAIGGGLHMTGGALGDLGSAVISKGKELRKRKNIAQVIDNLPEETKVALGRTSVAQAFEDRPVDIRPILKAENMALKERIEDLELKIAQSPKDSVELRQELERLKSQDLSPETKEATGSISDGEPITPFEPNSREDIENLSPSEPLTVEAVAEDIERANTNPDSRFIDESLMERQREELENLNLENRLEDAQEQADLATMEFKEMAEASGLDPKEILAEPDTQVKKSIEVKKALKAMALCQLGKG